MSLFDDETDDGKPIAGIQRNRQGRPYILADPDWSEDEARGRGFSERPAEPRGLSKLATRVTTYVGCLEDTYSLGQWQERMVILGLTLKRSLLAKAANIREDDPQFRDKMNEIANDAKEAARWHEKADLGTEFHETARQYDERTLSKMHRDYLGNEANSMLDAYREATSGWEYAHIEEFMVNDEFGWGGTPDRLTWVNCQKCMDEGNVRKFRDAKICLSVDDIKTGRIDYDQQKMALQMKAYSKSKLYDAETGIRTELPICQHQARIVHVPYGEGTCTVYPIDLEPLEPILTELVPAVRKWRSKNKLFGAPVASSDGGFGAGYADAADRADREQSGLAAAWPADPPRAT